eukprot:3940809-Rhodomonas_salina.3
MCTTTCTAGASSRLLSATHTLCVLGCEFHTSGRVPGTNVCTESVVPLYPISVPHIAHPTSQGDAIYARCWVDTKGLCRFLRIYTANLSAILPFNHRQVVTVRADRRTSRK